VSSSSCLTSRNSQKQLRLSLHQCGGTRRHSESLDGLCLISNSVFEQCCQNESQPKSILKSVLLQFTNTTSINCKHIRRAPLRCPSCNRLSISVLSTGLQVTCSYNGATWAQQTLYQMISTWRHGTSCAGAYSRTPRRADVRWFSSCSLTNMLFEVENVRFSPRPICNRGSSSDRLGSAAVWLEPG
jgi:hypothetical protein